MFGFSAIAVLLLLMPLCVILNILLKVHHGKVQTDTDIEEDNKSLYKQHLAEIDLDIENGLLEGTEALKVKEELKLTLLNHEDSEEKNRLTESKNPALTAIILLIIIPIFVISTYINLGEPELIETNEIMTEFRNASTQEEKIASVEKMLVKLEERMIKEPDDVDGWLMLTNSYTALERYADALKAVDNLYRLRGNDPTVMIRYADILAMNNDGSFIGRPSELLNEALAIDPENPSGLWFAGLAANDRGDIDAAIEYWKKLLPKLDNNPEQQKQVKQFIQMIGMQSDTYQKEILKELQQTNNEIKVNVALAEELIEQTNEDATVFIYAQAVNGSPAPIAVTRKSVAELPFDVTLNDSMAMIANNKLSNFNEVKVTARISKNGNAIPQSGDLIGSIDQVKTDNLETINILIDKIIP